MLRRMLVAVDFSVCSRSAARHACDVARAVGGTITLLHVLEDYDPRPPDLEAARALLQQLSLLARRPPNCLIVPARSESNGPDRATDDQSKAGRLEDEVALAILAAADHLDAELIVIGLRGQGSPTDGVLGQVARRVLLDARIPVQVVPCSANRPIVHRWSEALVDMAAR